MRVLQEKRYNWNSQNYQAFASYHKNKQHIVALAEMIATTQGVEEVIEPENLFSVIKKRFNKLISIIN